MSDPAGTPDAGLVRDMIRAVAEHMARVGREDVARALFAEADRLQGEIPAGWERSRKVERNAVVVDEFKKVHGRKTQHEYVCRAKWRHLLPQETPIEK